MTNTRTVLAVLGTTLLGLGLATTLTAGTTTTGPVGAIVAVLGNDYLFIVPLGIIGIGAMIATLTHRSIHGIDQATPRDPERIPTGDPPGATFDRLIGGGLQAAVTAHDRRDRARDRLREAAIRTVMHSSNCSREEARRRIDEGTWTDDHAVASFLTGDTNRRMGILAITAAISGQAPFQRQARRTVRAIERVNGDDHA